MSRRIVELSELCLCKGDGDSPIWIAVDGKVFDVSSSRAFYGPGGPYHALAGRDATWALAKDELDVAKIEESNKKNESFVFSGTELAKVENWLMRFENKYQQVGVLSQPSVFGDFGLDEGEEEAASRLGKLKPQQPRLVSKEEYLRRRLQKDSKL